MDTIELTVQFSREEYVRGVRGFLRARHLISWVQVLVLLLALFAVIVATIIMGSLNFLNTFTVVFILIATFFGAYQYFVLPGRSYDRTPVLREKHTYRFTREDFSRLNSEAAALLQWDVKHYRKRRGFVYLQFSDNSYLMLPTSAFQSEPRQAAFEELIYAANPRLKRKKENRSKKHDNL